MNKDKIKIFLIDDDALFLKMLEIEFHNNSDFTIETFTTGGLLLENLFQNPDVIILDYILNSINKNAMDGVETLDKIKAFNNEIPVIMLSSQEKNDVGIFCMHHNAFDYVVKNEKAFIRLQKIITSIFSNKKSEKELKWISDN